MHLALPLGQHPHHHGQDHQQLHGQKVPKNQYKLLPTAQTLPLLPHSPSQSPVGVNEYNDDPIGYHEEVGWGGQHYYERVAC